MENPAGRVVEERRDETIGDPGDNSMTAVGGVAATGDCLFIRSRNRRSVSKNESAIKQMLRRQDSFMSPVLATVAVAVGLMLMVMLALKRHLET